MSKVHNQNKGLPEHSMEVNDLWNSLYIYMSQNGCPNWVRK